LTGIDLAPNQHPQIKFIQGDIATANIEGPFDLITTFMVVEHLEDIQPFFLKMRHLLSDQGILMVNTFNNDSLIFRLARALNKVGLSTAYKRLYSHHHLQHYSKRSIRNILVRSGFDIVEHHCHNYPLRAVDVPKAGKMLEAAYRAFVGLVFLVSDPMGLGIEHTVFCRPTPPH
jgi:2-polyprenyl-3-methyl-5-hydroxy-6-metoxy-1,4-benzoquinol methylase